MNYSIMTVSVPIDSETYNEINEFFQRLMATEKKGYEKLCNVNLSQDLQTKGFYILAYDETTDKLIGVISAFDLIGIHIYEWSIVIDPMHRDTGIEESMLKVLSESFRKRGAEGDIVVLFETDYYVRKLIERYGYTYNYSETTLEAMVEKSEIKNPLTIRDYDGKTDLQTLMKIYSSAFGDLPDESMELINYTLFSEQSKLWIAEMDGVVVGTVTTTKNGENVWVTALAVHPDYQGMGIGSDLLKFVKSEASKSGIKKVLLEVENENEQALSIYEKAGFHKKLQMDYFTFNG